MNHRKKPASLVLPIFGLAFAVLLPHSASAQNQYAVIAAKNLLNRNGEGILNLAHPTVTYRSCEFWNPVAQRHGGFSLEFRIHFEEGGYSDVNFYFDQSGKVSDIGNGMANDGVPAFLFSGFMLEAVRAVVLNDPDMELSAETREIIRNAPNVKTLTLHILQLDQLFN